MSEEKVPYYTAYVICTNCGNKEEFLLEKGLEVKEYLKKVEGKEEAVCPKCGCERLKEMKYG